jgi:hypothetical protein
LTGRLPRLTLSKWMYNNKENRTMSEQSLQDTLAGESFEDNTELEVADVVDTPSETDEDVKEDAEHVEAEDGDNEQETEGEQAEKAEPTEADKVRHAMQKRLDKMRASQAAAEKAAAEANAELEKLRGNAVKDAAPKEEDFDTIAEYEKAVVDYRVEQELKARQEQAAQEKAMKAQYEAHEKARKAFEQKQHEFRSKKPDYDDKAKAFAETAEDLRRIKGDGHPTVAAIGQALIESDFTPELIYELGSNVELAEELAELSPIQAVRRLVLMEQEVAKPKQKTETAPKPIKPIKGASNASKRPEEMSAKELMRWASGK